MNFEQELLHCKNKRIAVTQLGLSELHKNVHTSRSITFLDHYISDRKAYLWDNDQAVVAWLETQESDDSHSIIRQNAECVKRDRVLRQVYNLIISNPEVATDAVVQLGQQLTVSQRSQVARILASMDDLNTSRASIDES